MPPGAGFAVPSRAGTFTVKGAGGRRTGDSVRLALRPENLRISGFGDAVRNGFIEGRILDRIYLGTDTTYHVAVAGDLVLVVRDQNVKSAHRDYAIHETVCLEAVPEILQFLKD